MHVPYFIHFVTFFCTQTSQITNILHIPHEAKINKHLTNI